MGIEARRMGRRRFSRHFGRTRLLVSCGLQGRPLKSLQGLSRRIRRLEGLWEAGMGLQQSFGSLV